jgi:hypothetical protein
MRYSKSVMLEADKLVEVMRRAKVPAFDVDTFGLDDRDNIHMLIKLARRHARLQEHSCNGTMTPRMETLERNTEARISMLAMTYGLRAEFQGDPRGYTTKLHTPSGDVFNTLGGRESGYGIGETS